MNDAMETNASCSSLCNRRILAFGLLPLDRTRLEPVLTEAGFDLIWADDGERARELLRHQKPDLVILDRSLLDPVGGILPSPRTPGSGLPCLVLDDHPTEENCLQALEWGADDYLARPFNPRELVARVKAILRRTVPHPPSSASGCLRFPGLSLNSQNYQVIMEGQPLYLTPREFDLLWHLARSPNRVLSREELLDAVWEDEGDHCLRTVDSTIERLRQKLRPASPQPWQIETIRGRGYRFRLEK